MSGKPRKFLKVIDSIKTWNSQGSQPPQSPKSQLEIEEKLKSEDLHFGKIARHGFPSDPRCIAFDPVQKLLAIGTKRGSIRVLGRAGVDCHLKHPTIQSPIQQIIFLVNEGALVSITNEDSVLLWSIRQKQPCVVHSLSFKKERLTTGFLSLGSKWLYIGTEQGNVHFIQVQNFIISGYVIYWNKSIDLTMSNHPGSVVQIAENPQDPNKLLIGFSTGFLVLWDLRGKMGEARFKCSEPLYSFSWHFEGKQFVTSHEHGILATWNYRQPQKPISVIHPHDREAQEDILPGKYSTIKKLQWIGTKTGESLLVLCGGEIISSGRFSSSITIIRGKKVSVMEMDAPIIDFTILCDSPFSNDATQPYSVAILLQNDLVLIDLLSPNYPSFKNPYAMDLHQPAVTTCHYLGECPSDLVPALYSIGIRNNSSNNNKSSTNASSSVSTPSSVAGPVAAGGNSIPGTDNESNTNSVISFTSTKDWPINGGQWGSAFSAYSELLVTGHEDGTVKFWDISSATMNMLYKFRIGKCFDVSTFPKNGSIQSPTTATSVHSSLCETDQDFFYDKVTCQNPLEVLHIKLCGCSRMLLIAGHYHAILFRFSKKELTTDIPTLEIVTDYDLQDEVREKAEESINKSSFQASNSPIYEQEMPRICSPPVRSGNRKWLPGFQPELLCQLVQCASWEIPPSSITCIALSPSHGLLAIGTGRGLAVVDYIQRTCLLSTGTPDLYGSMDPYVRVAYKPTMTKKEDLKTHSTEKTEKTIEPVSITSLKSSYTTTKPTHLSPTTTHPPQRSHSEVGARNGRLPPPPVPSQSSEADRRQRASSAAAENKPLEVLEEIPSDISMSTQGGDSENGHDLSKVNAAMDEIMQLVNQTDVEVEEAVEAMAYCNLTLQLNSPLNGADTLGADWVSVGSSMLDKAADPSTNAVQGSLGELSQSSPFSSSTHLSTAEGQSTDFPDLYDMKDQVNRTGADPHGSISSIPDAEVATGESEKQKPPPRPPQPQFTLSPTSSVKRPVYATLNARPSSPHTDSIVPESPLKRSRTTHNSMSMPRPQTFSFSSLTLKHQSQVEVIDIRNDEGPNLSASSGGISSVFNTSNNTIQHNKSRFPLFSNKLWNISPLTVMLHLRHRAEKNDLSQLARSTSASATSLETIYFEAVSALCFMDCYARKSDSTKQPALWIGTQMGSVLSLSIQMSQRRNTQRIIVAPAGTIFRLCGEIQCIGFLDCKGKLIQEPKMRWEESTTSVMNRVTDSDYPDSNSHSTPRSKGDTLTPEAHNGKGASTSQSSSSGTSPSGQSDFQMAVFCSEKQARIISLPSQKCIFKTKLTETSQVLHCSVLLLKGHPMLAVYMANGHLLCYTLPSLRLLLDAGECVPQPWADESRFTRCFAFGHNAQAIYLCSPTEIEKVSLSMQTFINMRETSVDLFLPCEMPPSPKKNFIQNIFTNVGSSLDRDELFGEATAGKASVGTASVSSNPKMERAQMSSAMAQSEIGKAKLAAIERGQRLGQLDEKTQEMVNEAKSFSRNAALLAKKYEEKNRWWPF